MADSPPPIARRDSDSPQAVASTPAPHATPDEGTSQGGCIVRRLRQTRADMIGTDDEQHYFDCHEAAAEIERLRLWGRLTADERRAVREAADAYELNNGDADCERIATTLRSLMARLG